MYSLQSSIANGVRDTTPYLNDDEEDNIDPSIDYSVLPYDNDHTNTLEEDGFAPEDENQDAYSSNYQEEPAHTRNMIEENTMYTNYTSYFDPTHQTSPMHHDFVHSNHADPLQSMYSYPVAPHTSAKNINNNNHNMNNGNNIIGDDDDDGKNMDGRFIDDFNDNTSSPQQPLDYNPSVFERLSTHTMSNSPPLARFLSQHLNPAVTTDHTHSYTNTSIPSFGNPEQTLNDPSSSSLPFTSYSPLHQSSRSNEHGNYMLHHVSTDYSDKGASIDLTSPVNAAYHLNTSQNQENYTKDTNIDTSYASTSQRKDKSKSHTTQSHQKSRKIKPPIYAERRNKTLLSNSSSSTFMPSYQSSIDHNDHVRTDVSTSTISHHQPDHDFNPHASTMDNYHLSYPVYMEEDVDQRITFENMDDATNMNLFYPSHHNDYHHDTPSNTSLTTTYTTLSSHTSNIPFDQTNNSYRHEDADVQAHHDSQEKVDDGRLINTTPPKPTYSSNDQPLTISNTTTLQAPIKSKPQTIPSNPSTKDKSPKSKSLSQRVSKITTTIATMPKGLIALVVIVFITTLALMIFQLRLYRRRRQTP